LAHGKKPPARKYVHTVIKYLLRLVSTFDLSLAIAAHISSGKLELERENREIPGLFDATISFHEEL
jgi:hypothetical protein